MIADRKGTRKALPVPVAPNLDSPPRPPVKATSSPAPAQGQASQTWRPSLSPPPMAADCLDHLAHVVATRALRRSASTSTVLIPDTVLLSDGARPLPCQSSGCQLQTPARLTAGHLRRATDGGDGGCAALAVRSQAAAQAVRRSLPALASRDRLKLLRRRDASYPCGGCSWRRSWQ